MTTGLQPSNSTGKDLLGWKLIDINCGEKEANRHSVANSLIQTLIPKANLKGCSDQQKDFLAGMLKKDPGISPQPGNQK